MEETGVPGSDFGLVGDISWVHQFLPPITTGQSWLVMQYSRKSDDKKKFQIPYSPD